MKNKYAYSRTYTNIPFTDVYDTKKHYADFIKWLVDLTNCQSYLEIGVNLGECIHEVRNVVKKCVGVDMSDKMPDKNNILFNLMSSDDFFKTNTDTYDIIFIDGDHHFPQVAKDFENSLKILNEFGIIILHDTDPILPDLIHINFCYDSYKIVDYIILNHPELNIMTYPIHETGLTTVMRKKDRRINKFLKG
jgi:predicted O-methyltransferase YrrM